MIACYQNVVFSELLPILLGSEHLDRFGLLPRPPGTYFEGREAALYPNVASEWAAAAFAFDHLAPNHVELRDPLYRRLIAVDVRYVQNAPLFHYKFFDELLAGAVASHSYTNDFFYASSLAYSHNQVGNRFGRALLTA